MKLEIFTPAETLFSGEADAVFFPGTMGAFELLEGHAPIISSLGKGRIVYRQGEVETAVEIVSGFMKNENGHVVACIEQ